MTITIDISYMDITVWASFITVGLFIFQVLRFLFKWLSNLYKKGFKKYSGDIAANVQYPIKKEILIILLKRLIKIIIRKEVDPAAPSLINLVVTLPSD